jgi:[acyl-carrier-protein] S-malonyltransferase
MGEFSALVCAGALTFEDALRLVRERGRLMKQAGADCPGGMASIINLERAVLADVCAEAAQATGSVVQIANDNAPGQIVISGAKPALDKALELARARGAKKCIPLAVSIASHSALMAPAAREFHHVLAATPFAEPRLPVIGNVTAQRLVAHDLRAELEAQLTSAVRWTESVEYMAGQGVTHFIEIGPKDVLCGLIKRIRPETIRHAVGDPEGVAALRA